MNFLAHAYLSFNDPEILAGNMISDFVKGSAQFSFSGKIQKGIILHRAIDEFTDRHEATLQAKQIFRPAYRLYSGAIIDILYDHFLANDDNEFSGGVLEKFSLDVYSKLELLSAQLPSRFLIAFTYMRSQNWLCNYRTKEGMQKSLNGLIRRAAYLSESETAYQLFLEHYIELNECYRRFFKDVKLFAKQRFERLVL